MKKHFSVVAALSLYFVSSGTYALTEGQQSDASEKLGADPDGQGLVRSPVDGVTLELNQGKTRARLELDFGTLIPKYFNDLNRLGLTASGPINDSRTEASTVAEDPFSSATILSLSFTHIYWKPVISMENAYSVSTLCRSFMASIGMPNVKKGCGEHLFKDDSLVGQIRAPGSTPGTVSTAQRAVAAQWKAVHDALVRQDSCLKAQPMIVVDRDTGLPVSNLPAISVEDIISCAKPAPLQSFRFSVTAGTQAVTVAETEDNPDGVETKVPWAAQFSYGYVTNSNNTFGIAAGYQAVVRTETGQACTSDSTDGTITCETTTEASDELHDEGFIKLQYRHRFGNLGVGLLADYNLDSEITTLRLPLFVARNPTQDGLNGGISLNWDSQQRDPRLEIYVGQYFSVM